MKCISRIANIETAQFGDGHHKFYLEDRCNNPCIPNMDVCKRCVEKNESCKLQQTRKFNHGKVTQPIPQESHIYDGQWFHTMCKKYGTPAVEILEFANQLQRKARLVVDTDRVANTVADVHVDTDDSIIKDMRQLSIGKIAQPRPDPVRVKPKRQKTKPDIAKTSQGITKEICVPTHIETSLEMIDTDEYDIEYVKLRAFEHNNKLYLRDSNKNKLYENIENRVENWKLYWQI